MNLIKALPYLLILLFAACKKDLPSGGHPEPVPEWTSYTTANSALPDDQVNALAIDRHDVKWLGTSKGLVRMSGTSFILFTPSNSPLPDPYITAVAVDENGTVWAGTRAGLAAYNGTAWSVYTSANSALPDNAVSCLTYDAAHKTLWAGTGEGLAKIDGRGQWQQVYVSGVILSMAADRQGVLWVGTFNDFAFRGMIKRWDGTQWTTYQLHDLGYSSALPYGLGIDSTGAPVAALGGTAAKSILRLNGGTWEELAKPDGAGGFKTLLVDGGRIWVGGRNLFSCGSREAPLISLPGTDSPVMAMARDSKGLLWLGTVYAGLVAYHPPAGS